MHAAALSQLSALLSHVRAGTVCAPRLSPATMIASSDTQPPMPAPATTGSGAAADGTQSRSGVGSDAGRLRFVDIGLNLLDSMFEGEYRGKSTHPPDVEGVLARAADAGVSHAIVTAGSLSEAKRALECVRKHRASASPVALYSTVGVHPTRALDFLPSPERDEVESAMRVLAGTEGGDSGDVVDAAAALAAVEARVLALPHVQDAISSHVAALRDVIEQGVAEGIVVAVGECGLDYDRLFFCPSAVQRAGFEAQLRLAESSNLPLFLHNRNTGGDFAALCAAQRACFRRHGGVVHSFDGGADELRELLDLGLAIGLNGCSLKTEENLAVAASVPLSALHLETDAPWCAIKRTHAGHKYVRPLRANASGEPWPEVKKERWHEGCTVKDRCEPCHITHVLQVVAGARQQYGATDATEESVAAAAYTNSQRLFWPKL